MRLLLCLVFACFLSCRKADSALPTTPPTSIDSVKSTATDPVKSIVLFTTEKNAYVISVYNPDMSLRWSKSMPALGRTITGTYCSGNVVYPYTTTMNTLDITTGLPSWFFTNLSGWDPPAVNNGVLYHPQTNELLELNAKTGSRLPSSGFWVPEMVPMTPLYKDSVVYVVCSTPLAAYSMKAIDLKTRTVKWTTSLGINPNRGMVITKGILTVCSGTSSLLAIDIQTGSKIWEAKDRIYTDYVIADNILYAVGDGSPVILRALNLQTGAELWNWKDATPTFALRNLYLYNGRLLVESHRNEQYLVALNPATGAEMERQRIVPESDNGKPVIYDGKLYQFRKDRQTNIAALIVHDLKTNKRIDSIPHGTDAYFSNMLIVTNGMN